MGLPGSDFLHKRTTCALSTRMLQSPSPTPSMTSFTDHYGQVCRRRRCRTFAPLLAALSSGSGGSSRALRVDVTRVTEDQWVGLREALATDTDLEEIHLEVDLSQVKSRPTTAAGKRPTTAPSSSSSSNGAVAIAEPVSCGRLMKAIAQCIVSSTSLRAVQLVGFRMPVKALKHLNDALGSERCGLKMLALRDCPIGDKGFSTLTAGLSQCRSLRSISLSGCRLTGASAEALAAVLKRHSERMDEMRWQSGLRGESYHGGDGLQYIDVSRNQLDDTAALELARALRPDVWLRALNLRANAIGVAGVRAIAEVVDDGPKEVRALTSVSLSDNPGCVSFWTAVHQAGEEDDLATAGVFAYAPRSWEFCAPNPQTSAVTTAKKKPTAAKKKKSGGRTVVRVDAERLGELEERLAALVQHTGNSNYNDDDDLSAVADVQRDLHALIHAGKKLRPSTATTSANTTTTRTGQQQQQKQQQQQQSTAVTVSGKGKSSGRRKRSGKKADGATTTTAASAASADVSSISHSAHVSYLTDEISKLKRELLKERSDLTTAARTIPAHAPPPQTSPQKRQQPTATATATAAATSGATKLGERQGSVGTMEDEVLDRLEKSLRLFNDVVQRFEGAEKK